MSVRRRRAARRRGSRGCGRRLLLGLAIANKQWALLAAIPVLAALPRSRRSACLAAATAVAAAILAPLVLVGSGGFVTAARASATAPSTIFQPWQVWWFFGHHGALVHGAFGVPKPDYRSGPAWTATVSHPLVVVAGFSLGALVWLRERAAGRIGARQALLALALVMLVRCVLDTWDTEYYLLPFVLALLAWEVAAQAVRPPVLALTASVLAWVSFQWLPAHASPDVQAAAFLAWSLPLAGLARVAAVRARRRVAAPARTAAAGRLRRSRERSRDRRQRLVQAVEYFLTVLADDQQILDAHAETRPAGRRPARRSRRCPPPARRSPSVRDSRGASWMSMPTPCPRPWPKCSPCPAASMTSRATASTSRPVGPAWTAARPANWASSTSS